MPAFEKLERICVLRLSAIGDVCHTLPVVRTVQHAFPDAKITWVIGKLEAGLLADIPGIEFIEFDKRAGWREYRRVGKLLADRRFDVLLHMQAALRASLLSLRIPAGDRIGFDFARARDFQWLFTNSRINGNAKQHVMDSLFDFGHALGITEKRLAWDIPVPDEAKAFAERVIENAQALVISPCSSQRFRNYRNWPAERFAAVADHAVQNHGLKVIISGGPTAMEQEFAKRITSAMRCDAVDLVGKTSLKQLLAVLQRARALLAPDSGPVHMANAVETPVIGLYATSNPARTGPYNFQEFVVNRYPNALREFMGKSIEQVRWGQRVRHPEAMNLITTEAVQEKLDLLLATAVRS